MWREPSGSYGNLYGFGHWYTLGYKIIGWATSSTGTKVYNKHHIFTPSMVNNLVGDAASKTLKLYALWDYNGTVRIYKDGAWKMALPYVYAKVGTETSPSWHLALPYTYA
jgi:hypothetical protein